MLIRPAGEPSAAVNGSPDLPVAGGVARSAFVRAPLSVAEEASVHSRMFKSRAETEGSSGIDFGVRRSVQVSHPATRVRFELSAFVAWFELSGRSLSGNRITPVFWSLSSHSLAPAPV